MLIRCQTLLEDWQRTYLSDLCKKYSISFSKAVRVMISLSIICGDKNLFPEGHHLKKDKKLHQLMTKKNSSKELHGSMLSKLHHEARKIIDKQIKK